MFPTPFRHLLFLPVLAVVPLSPAAESTAVNPRTAPPRDLALFLLIGQSNMAGRGKVEPQDREPLSGVWTFTPAGQWAPAIDPLHADKPTAGVGLARSFAHALQRVGYAQNIGLIPCAFGGSALDEWQPGQPHFKNAVARAKQAMAAGQLRGILWHQGEEDAKSAAKADTYAARFAKMLAALRTELAAPDAPVVVGALGEFLPARNGNTHPHARAVNQQLASLAKDDPRIGLVDSAGLADQGDQLHFSAAALRTFGRRYAEEFLRLKR